MSRIDMIFRARNVSHDLSRSGKKVLITRAVHIGLRGSFGQQHCNPRTLRSHQIGKMVSLEGIVTRCRSAPGFLDPVTEPAFPRRLPRPPKDAPIDPLRPTQPSIPLPNVPRQPNHQRLLGLGLLRAKYDRHPERRREREPGPDGVWVVHFPGPSDG